MSDNNLEHYRGRDGRRERERGVKRGRGRGGRREGGRSGMAKEKGLCINEYTPVCPIMMFIKGKAVSFTCISGFTTVRYMT